MRSGHIAAGDGVAVARGHATRPLAEAVARPFKVVTRMAKAVRGHAEHRIVLGIGRGDDDMLRPHIGEHRAFQTVEIAKRQMLDRLDKAGAIMAAQVAMRTRHRGLRDLHAGAGLGGQLCEARLKDAQRGQIGVQRGDPGDTRQQQKPQDQVAGAAAQIEESLCAGLLDRVDHRREAGLVHRGGHGTGICIRATSLRGIAQDQPRVAATCSSVSAR